MIKVIKHGQKEFIHTCSRCGCEFTYEHEDIQSDAVRSLTNYSNTRYVKCPDCGAICYISSTNSWPTPYYEPTTVPFNTPSGTKDCQECDWWKKITQPGGFNYIGDTPCTWCPKNPYRATCFDSSGTSSNIFCKDNTTGIANKYTKITWDDTDKTDSAASDSTTTNDGNIGSFTANSVKDEAFNG